MVAWGRFELRLAAYLSTMVDPPTRVVVLRGHFHLPYRSGSRSRQTLLFSGQPFAPEHLSDALDAFFAAMTETREDLALRTGGTAG